MTKLRQPTTLLAALLFALATVACDHTPICPPNTAYDPAVRRCRIIDPSLGEVDAYVPPAPDGGPIPTDAPSAEDAPADDGGGEDASTEDGGDTTDV